MPTDYRVNRCVKEILDDGHYPWSLTTDIEGDSTLGVSIKFFDTEKCVWRRINIYSSDLNPQDVKLAKETITCFRMFSFPRQVGSLYDLKITTHNRY